MSTDWKPYTLQHGDHLKRLAFRLGAPPGEIWMHGKNEALRQRRNNMDVLCVGDVVFLPPPALPKLDIKAGTRNKYEATIPTVKIELELATAGNVLANQPYEIHMPGIGGKPLTGTTTANAEVSVDVPVVARKVEIHIPDAGVVVPLTIGALDPIDAPSGLAQRLENLGYLDGHVPLTAVRVRRALRGFQADRGLPATGEIDPDTNKALEEAHGS